MTESSLKIIMIRSTAQNLVGACTDYQIMFCAAASGRIKKMETTIEELSNLDLDSLYQWIVLEERTIRFSTYA